MPAIIRVRYLVVHTEAHPGGKHGTTEGIRRYHTDPKDLTGGRVVWGGRTYPDRSLLPASVRSRRGNGWNDIGYHRVIEEDGSEHAGRSELIMGAGVSGFNKEALHVCVTGHGDLEPFNPAQMLTLIHLLRHWMEKYKVPVDRVLGHRECYAFPGVPNTGKTCPGTKVDMDEIRRLVAGEQEPPVFVPEIVPEVVTVRREEPALPTVPPHLEEVRLPPREVTPVAAQPAESGRRNLFPDDPMSVLVLAKAIWKSKTLWVNFLVMLGSLLGVLQGMIVESGVVLPAGVAATIGFLVAAINFVLRFFTNRPVAVTEQKKPVPGG